MANCGLDLRLHNIGKIIAAVRIWPISTPVLNPTNGIAIAIPFEPTPISRKALAKPKPWTKPKQNVSQARCDTAFRRIKLSIATYMIVAAINGSIRRLGISTQPRVATARLIECATVNAVTTLKIEEIRLQPSNSANRNNR